MRFDEVGLDPQGLLAVGDGFVNLARLRQGDPQIAVRLGVIGIDSQGVLVQLHGLGHLAQFVHGSSSVIVHVGATLDARQQVKRHREGQQQAPSPTRHTSAEG
ncbi:MAG: hypothetical protein ABSD58_04830 [Verrucomicrobiia bacterium]